MRTLYVTGRADDARGEKLLASGSDDANDSPNDVPYDHRMWNMGTTMPPRSGMIIVEWNQKYVFLTAPVNQLIIPRFELLPFELLPFFQHLASSIRLVELLALG